MWIGVATSRLLCETVSAVNEKIGRFSHNQFRPEEQRQKWLLKPVNEASSVPLPFPLKKDSWSDLYSDQSLSVSQSG